LIRMRRPRQLKWTREHYSAMAAAELIFSSKF
jgi:ribosomal protein L24E